MEVATIPGAKFSFIAYAERGVGGDDVHAETRLGGDNVFYE